MTPKEAGFIREAFKASLAGSLSLALAGFFQLPEPYWAAVSAIIVVQSDLSAAIKASLNRLVGTVIGAFVGACAYSLLGPTLWSFALAVLCASLICALFGRWETYRFSGVTVAIVMLVAHHGTPWVVAFHRFLEVSFGIVVAFLVTISFVKFYNGQSRPQKR